METKKTAKHPIWRNIGAALLALLGLLAAQLFVFGVWIAGTALNQYRFHSVPLETAIESSVQSLLDHQCLLLIAADLILLAVLTLVFRRKHSTLAKEVNFSRFNPLLFLLFLIIGFAANFAVSYLLSLIPFPESWLGSYESAASLLSKEPFALQLAAVAILGPIAEEVTFRGLVYRRFRRIMPKALAVIVESVLFGLFHGQAIWILYSTLMGVFLTVVAEKTDNLAYSVAAHIGFNLLGIL